MWPALFRYIIKVCCKRGLVCFKKSFAFYVGRMNVKIFKFGMNLGAMSRLKLYAICPDNMITSLASEL